MQTSPDTEKCDLGDQLFLEALYQKHKRVLFLVARKSVDYKEDIAADLLQTAMRKLVRKVRLLKTMDEATQCAYLVQTVRNTGAQYIHRYGIEKKIFSGGDFEEETRSIRDPAASPEELVIREEHVEAQKKALSKLSEQEQMLIRGKYLLGQTDQQLAEMIGCKPENIRMKLSRARKKARAYLQEGEETREE